ncbi:MAG: AAA family ATPase [Candidatus Aenigmatarchaeota archaeon]
MKLELLIKNFKSIKEIKAELAEVNILIGPPNAGKSNILEAIHLYGIPARANFIGSEYVKYFDFKVIRGFETNNFSIFRDNDYSNIIELKIGNKDLLRISYSKDKNNIIFNDDVSLERITTELTILYRYENFIKNFRGEKYKYGYFNKFLLPNFGNLETILARNVKNIIKKINNNIKKYNVLIAKYGTSNDKALIFTYTGSETPIIYPIPIDEIENIAQSIQYFILFSTALYSLENFGEVIRDEDINIVALFEEPDAHMFPILIEEFIDILKEVEHLNVIITTHNPHTLIRSIDKIPKDKIKTFVVHREEGYTNMTEIDIDKLRDIYIEVGDTEIIRNIENYMKELKK